MDHLRDIVSFSLRGILAAISGGIVRCHNEFCSRTCASPEFAHIFSATTASLGLTWNSCMCQSGDTRRFDLCRHLMCVGTLCATKSTVRGRRWATDSSRKEVVPVVVDFEVAVPR